MAYRADRALDNVARCGRRSALAAEELMTNELTAAQQLKFDLFRYGVHITSEAEAFMMQPFGERPITLADYASTSGVTLVLEEHVWVNTPIARYNPNMVVQPRHELHIWGGGLIVRELASGREIPARFVPVPAYHNQFNVHGEAFTEFVHSHTDRAETLSRTRLRHAVPFLRSSVQIPRTILSQAN